MNELAASPCSETEADPRWRLIQRILSSQRFRRATQLRSFLLYITNQALLGHAAISESDIGINVLKRREDFNPNEDNIVRVQARQLRKKLEEYFESDGRDEEWIVTIPKGSYLPEFKPRNRPDPLPRSARSFPSNPPVRLAVVGLAVLILALLAAWLMLRGRHAGQAQAGAPAGPVNPLWARLFVEGQKANIVVSDLGVVMLQRHLRAAITLEQYLSRDYPLNLLPPKSSTESEQILRSLASLQYTGFHDLSVSTKLLECSRRYKGQTAIRFPRHLNIRDLGTDNFIMVGASIPWDQLFWQQLGYSLEYDFVSGQNSFHDKLAAPGGRGYRTSRVFRTASDENGTNESYAVVAMVPNLGGSGSVLLLLGLTAVPMEGAEELLARPDFPAIFHNSGGCRTVDLAKDSFELLIRTRAVAFAPQASELLACRPLPATQARQ